jgi:hypothetical protein
MKDGKEDTKGKKMVNNCCGAFARILSLIFVNGGSVLKLSEANHCA